MIETPFYEQAAKFLRIYDTYSTELAWWEDYFCEMINDTADRETFTGLQALIAEKEGVQEPTNEEICKIIS